MTRVIDNNIGQPVDFKVGGDGDCPGIAQTVTLDDIEAIAFSDRPPEDRKQQLRHEA